MQENTNKAIAINSLIMYARMAINTILALVTTRFALQALGVNNYGLFSVCGSIISFIGVFNTIMLSTCNRFLAVAIGKGDENNINKVFNINLSIFIGCAFLMMVLTLPLGLWYVYTHLNYDGPIENAVMVFVLSVLGSIFSTLAIPYNGMLMAKERFFLFSFVDVFIHVIRFFVIFALVYYFSEKLLIYTLLQVFTVCLPAIVYYLYCHKIFPNIVQWKPVHDKNAYKEVFAFSGWVAYGAFASVARQQAAAILVNLFFNTVMNTALGIANTMNMYVSMFANNLTQPMQPQITKSYAAGNTKRTDELLVMSTKYSFLMMLLLGSAFFVGTDWIVDLWLGQVPPYVSSFVILLIIDNLVLSFNSGLSLVLFASGKIALYQIVINTLRLITILFAYIILKSGSEPQALFYSYIIFSILIVFATQWCLRKTLHYDISSLVRKSYIPSLLTLLSFLPILFLQINVHPLTRILLTMLYLLIIEFFVGLSKHEREGITRRIIGLFANVRF